MLLEKLVIPKEYIGMLIKSSIIKSAGNFIFYCLELAYENLTSYILCTNKLQQSRLLICNLKKLRKGLHRNFILIAFIKFMYQDHVWFMCH